MDLERCPLRERGIYSFLQNTGIVWKSAAASALSWEAARLAGSAHPYLAPITVILVIQTTIAGSLRHAYQRILGTVIGVLLTAAVARHLGIHWWSIGLLIFAGTGTARAFKLKDPVLHQVAMSILLVLIFENHTTSYAWDRIRDTLIGAAAGVLLQYMVPPDYTQKAGQAVTKLADHLASAYESTSAWIQTGCSSDREQAWRRSLQGLLKEMRRTDQAVHKAAKSLQFNPWSKRSKERLGDLKQQFETLRTGHDRLSGMIRNLEEWSLSGSIPPDERQVWAQTMRGLAGAITHWSRQVPASIQPQGSGPAHASPVSLPGADGSTLEANFSPRLWAGMPLTSSSCFPLLLPLRKEPFFEGDRHSTPAYQYRRKAQSPGNG
ncbi:FUSC family protein [Paenibacillus sp. CC-CFT747]|nr:FUSC family protein [Paenibacillus sp. CC-CFT747]